MRPVIRLVVATSTAIGAGLLAAGPAAACGGLVGENGSIALVRTTTLAAWHDGVEHYVTAFAFAGGGGAFGGGGAAGAVGMEIRMERRSFSARSRFKASSRRRRSSSARAF